jgi:hypothetical protein
MTDPLKVEDVASYLTETGWQQAPGWRGAMLWRYPGDYEVLVPAHDGMGDGDRRIREVLRCLAAVEDRPALEIAQEIARPQLDRQYFRTFSRRHDSGYTSLAAGVQTLQGIHSILRTAARTVLQGPHFAFGGRLPAAVGDIMRAAELGPTRSGSYIVETRLRADVIARGTNGDEAMTGRAVLVQMSEAVSAARAAALTDDPAAFDETVTAGVSADLCGALSDLAGSDRDEPFGITFRWARSQPIDTPPKVVEFPGNAGVLLRAAAERLRGLNAAGPATVTGVVEGLYDDAAGNDRWRIKIRGELRTEHIQRARRAVWVRLANQSAYDRAITAHRQRRPITVTGELSSTTGRVELVPGRGFEL